MQWCCRHHANIGDELLSLCPCPHGVALRDDNLANSKGRQPKSVLTRDQDLFLMFYLHKYEFSLQNSHTG